MAPRVSVILPIYNAGSYLRSAITSILEQTYSDFELIIINDGSTDNSGMVVKSFSDPRIRSIEQKNQGLRQTLNTGIDLSRGEYIARMDQDDIALPERLAKQVAFLDSHSDHVLVGTTFAYMNEHGELTGIFPALLDNADLQLEVLTQSPFGHGTVMFRASTLRQHGLRYNEQAVHVEDYEMWTKLSQIGKIANLPEVLYLWRYYPGSTSGKNAPLQRRSKARLQDEAFHAGRYRNVIGRSGLTRFRRYHNESTSVQGHSLRIDRRNGLSLMYVNFSIVFARHRQFWKSLQAMLFSLIIQPTYLPSLVIRKIFRPHANLYRQ